MALKKHTFAANEIAIFDDAVVYKRGEYWQMRMWLTKEKKYARFSLKTRNESTAIDKAKLKYHELMAQQYSGKTYFSKTTKQGVEEYLKQRNKDVDAKLIVKGRYGTIKTHLEHWLNFIGRDAKLKELNRTDCENYYHERTKTKKNLSISQTTVANEQSTINAMIGWLYKLNETYIDAFDFKKLPRIDSKDDKIRRSTFSPNEYEDIEEAICKYWIRSEKDSDDEYKQRKLACFYFLIAAATGLRTGEQRQLKWGDLEWTRVFRDKKTVSVVQLSIRSETSKVRTSRTFMVTDKGCFKDLRTFMSNEAEKIPTKESLIFSFDGANVITQRAVLYHFAKVVELAEIENIKNRDIVPYSFRHYFITQKIMSGLSLIRVANMCGTSVAQIEKTYFHLNYEMMMTDALADYEYDEDGNVVAV